MTELGISDLAGVSRRSSIWYNGTVLFWKDILVFGH